MSNDVNVRNSIPAVVKPKGDLVAAKLPPLRLQLRDMVESGTLQVTVDLAAVGMVDSAGIGLLIGTHNLLKKIGGELSVVHASSDIFELFRKMRIPQHFSVSGTDR